MHILDARGCFLIVPHATAFVGRSSEMSNGEDAMVGSKGGKAQGRLATTVGWDYLPVPDQMHGTRYLGLRTVIINSPQDM